ncbi:MAG: type VII toxin-antitoxin system HepT family RNase toxin [Candidatus Brocadia sp.]
MHQSMNKRDIQTKIDVIIDNLEKLHILKSKSYNDFISDFRNIDSALHRLQTSIQALLDIGSYIIASLGLRTPNTNAEIIEILNEAGCIPTDKTRTYIEMSQFRNRIVHLYNHIDTKALYDILANELGDIKDFYIKLLEIIDKY